MNLTTEQQQHLHQGEPLEVVIAGEEYVILPRQLYDRLQRTEYDASPWTIEEMDLLAGEAAELVSGDGFDSEDD